MCGILLLGDRQLLVFGLDRHAIAATLAGVGIVLGIVAFGLASTRTRNAAAFGFHAVAIVLLVALGVLLAGTYAFAFSGDKYVSIPGEGGDRDVVLRQSQAMLGGVSTQVFVRDGLVLIPVGGFSAERGEFLNEASVSVRFASDEVELAVNHDSVRSLHRYQVDRSS